jgi:hypothetical protein
MWVKASTVYASRYPTLEETMNAFYQHHQDSIAFQYRCFDRILLNGLIQPFQQPERVIGFFNTYRQGQRVTRSLLTDIADQFRDWITQRARSGACPSWTLPRAAAMISWIPTSGAPSPMKSWSF